MFIVYQEEVQFVQNLRIIVMHTVYPGSLDPPEKILYLHQKMRFTPLMNY